MRRYMASRALAKLINAFNNETLNSRARAGKVARGLQHCILQR